MQIGQLFYGPQGLGERSTNPHIQNVRGGGGPCEANRRKPLRFNSSYIGPTTARPNILVFVKRLSRMQTDAHKIPLNSHETGFVPKLEKRLYPGINVYITKFLNSRVAYIYQATYLKRAPLKRLNSIKSLHCKTN